MKINSKDPSRTRCLLFGGSGLVGSELRLLLETEAYEVRAPSHREVDCRSETAVRESVRVFRPQAVVMAAARVGGILANIRHGSEFLYDNALMNLVTLQVCAEERVPKVLVFGSSCMYPRNLERPLTAEDLLGGPLEPTSEGYAAAKIVTTVYARALRREGRTCAIVCVPASLYGERDHFSAEEGHLVSSLIVKIHQAKEAGKPQLELWGDGTPRRDFLHVSDAARAILRILAAEEVPDLVHVGSSQDWTVREIAQKVAEVIGFKGELVFKGAGSNGTFRKLLAVDWLSGQGWSPRVPFEEGLRRAYQAYLSQVGAAAAALE